MKTRYALLAASFLVGTVGIALGEDR